MLVWAGLVAELFLAQAAPRTPPVAIAPAGDACPSAGQVAEALAARLPTGVSLAGEAPAGGFLLRVVSEGPNAVRVELVDGAGRLALERALTSPPDATREHCRALADTVALVVRRYLREIEFRAPADRLAPVVPPPAPVSPPRHPAPPRGPWVFLGGAVRPRLTEGDTGVRPEALLGTGGIVGRWWLGAAGALGVPVTRNADTGELRLSPFSMRIEAGPVWRPRSSVLALLAAGGVDLLSYTTRGVFEGRSGLSVEPVAELGCAWIVPSTAGIAVRAGLAAAVSLEPRDFGLEGGTGPVYRSSRLSLRLSLSFALRVAESQH